MMTFVLVALALTPLDAAKAHLAKGQLSDVVFDLDGQKLKAAEQPEALKVLTSAAKGALDQKDTVLALHLAQMSLKLDAKSTSSLEVASRAAFAQEMFADAERHADAWIAAEPKSPPARLLRAQLAAEAGEWDRVLEHLQAVTLDSPEAKKLEQRAKSEKAERTTEMQRAMEEVAKRPPPPAPPPPPPKEIVVYGTSWCGYCAKARAWLKQRGVPFIDKDIEADPAAAEELARKAAEAGVRTRGVPVVDVGGTLVLGFDPARMEQAL